MRDRRLQSATEVGTIDLTGVLTSASRDGAGATSYTAPGAASPAGGAAAAGSAAGAAGATAGGKANGEGTGAGGATATAGTAGAAGAAGAGSSAASAATMSFDSASAGGTAAAATATGAGSLRSCFFSDGGATAPSSSSPSSSNNRRRFQFVQYGDTLPANYSLMKTIACDGNVSGATVQLTHWTGNETEEKYYADTSTEIAMNFIEHNNEDDSDEYADAIVLNNHYDTDGVLSCFALLEPEFALKHKNQTLMITIL